MLATEINNVYVIVIIALRNKKKIETIDEFCCPVS